MIFASSSNLFLKMLQRYRTLDQTVKGKLTFKTAKTSIESDCAILDKFKNELLSENTGRDIKGKYFYFLQRYLRDTQKEKCKPHQAHYFSVDLPDKKHLEHPIPQNKILQAYLDGDISALEAIHMPLCLISDFDKHYLQGEWEQNATWEFPFMRYRLSGLKIPIKNLRGEIINFETWTIKDHFDMLGIETKEQI